jgi:hypothetical protein
VVERPEAARIALPRSPTSVGTARRFIAARTTAWSFPEPAAAWAWSPPSVTAGG